MLQPGDTVDRYVVEAVIGEGGMGRVYRALDPRIGRRVALKVLLAGDGPVSDVAKSRMLREARADHALDDTKIVMVTTEAENDHIEAALDAGADEYLVKPFDEAGLFDKLRMAGVAEL